MARVGWDAVGHPQRHGHGRPPLPPRALRPTPPRTRWEGRREMQRRREGGEWMVAVEGVVLGEAEREAAAADLLMSEESGVVRVWAGAGYWVRPDLPWRFYYNKCHG